MKLEIKNLENRIQPKKKPDIKVILIELGKKFAQSNDFKYHKQAKNIFAEHPGFRQKPEQKNAHLWDGFNMISIADFDTRYHWPEFAEWTWQDHAVDLANEALWLAEIGIEANIQYSQTELVDLFLQNTGSGLPENEPEFMTGFLRQKYWVLYEISQLKTQKYFRDDRGFYDIVPFFSYIKKSVSELPIEKNWRRDRQNLFKI